MDEPVVIQKDSHMRSLFTLRAPEENKIPGDPLSAKETSGVRLGTAAVTTRGFTEADMVEVADLINLAVRDFDAQKQNIDARVAALCKKHPIYE